ncbi:hypothetical protein, partial [Alistipes putredinis]
SSNAGKYRKKTAKIFMAGGFISSKERETLTLLSKDTEYASDLQTCEWKSAQKFPPKRLFRREANRNRSTILPKTVLIPRSPPPNAIRRGFRESAAYSAKKEFIFYIF